MELAVSRSRPYTWSALSYLAIGALIGVLSWDGAGAVWSLAWLAWLPIMWGLAGSRWSASAVMLGYYLAAARGLPGGAAIFFGDTAPGWWGWMFWGLACALLSAPFAVLWSKDRGVRSWRFAVAVCTSAVPPLGIVGWVNPLAIAGTGFPGCGWLGLVLALWLMAALVGGHWRWVGVLVGVSIAANAVAGVVMPTNWRGVDTHFSRLASGGSSDAGLILAGMQRVESVVQLARSVPNNSVWVLPETILGPVDAVAEMALAETERALAARGSRLLAGAELLQPDGKYQNVVMVLGSGSGEARAAVQGIPVPVAMWKPWADDGAAADLLGRGNVIEVGGRRAAAAVCYEQLLPFSLLSIMARKPDVVVAVSNIWWARETSIPGIQRQTVEAFGRLFGVGVVVARNF